ncbi:hypothetical protein P170DRAFT_424466 [Aspergillus steynii IBT 23096]|uniref:Uncharacterized protein n=1 Tax=Aspergillus steynii IBT 23096 TaxID=1392250 RepID=A0A2I2GAY3_9EURO|nr:uncharacterized protein P170DRAFT_424466 [Aspergillus steynii IBT 23096]PLB50039.1 hypothetical protein P170DRAFT_424466 [Aspergillus steynii IBT 23096]
MTLLDPCKPIDQPIDGPALPFKYRNSWEVILFFDMDLNTRHHCLGAVCDSLTRQLEHTYRVYGDALGEVPPGYTRLAVTYHLSDLPPPRQYTDPEAVYQRIDTYLKNYIRLYEPFRTIEVKKRWRFIDTVCFGIYEVTSEFNRITGMQNDQPC